MRQKPSFSGIGAQPQQKQPLATMGKKPAVGGGTSLAALMNQYDEGDYSTISLKMNNEASRLQVKIEEKPTGLLGFGGGGEDWMRKQQPSPLRMANKENIHDQPGYRKKSVVEVNRFADCVRQIEKNKHYGDASQDEELAAFQPRGGKSPLRGRTTTPLAGTPSSSLLRHAEEDLVFRAKVTDTTKPVNFTDLSKRFNGGGLESTPKELQRQTPTRSRSKLAPRVMKQFQESDESEHDSEAISLKESISEQKSKLFKFHANMRPEQKEELERKVHQIKQDNLKVLAEKKTQNGNKVLPRFVEDIKVNVAREIEEYARNLMEKQEDRQVEPTQKFNLSGLTEDAKRKKIIEETKSHIKDIVEVKEKKASFEEEDFRQYSTHPTQKPVFGRVQESADKALAEELTRRQQLEEQNELRRRVEEQQKIDSELLSRRLAEEQEHRMRLDAEEAARREQAFAESEKLRIQQEERLLEIERQRMLIEQRAEAERKMREELLEKERLEAQEARQRQLQWEEAERRREKQFEEERKRIEKERRENEQIQAKLAEEEKERLDAEEKRRAEFALRMERERAEVERIRLEKLEQERQRELELARIAQQERLEAQLERQQRLEEQRKMLQQIEEQRRQDEARHQEELRLEQERQFRLRREEEQRILQELEQERRSKEMAQQAAEQVRMQMELERKINEEMERQREKEEIEFLARQEQQRRERLKFEQEERDRLEREREEKERVERDRLAQATRELEEKQRLEREQRQREEQRERKEIEETKKEEENRERIRQRMIEEDQLLKKQLEEDARKTEEERMKLQTVNAAVLLPQTSISQVSSPVEPLKTSLKVESLFASYSIFQGTSEPSITPEDRINKIFDKARNDKPMDVDFKFDFGLDLSIDEDSKTKKVTFDESTLNSRDRLPPFGARHR